MEATPGFSVHRGPQAYLLASSFGGLSDLSRLPFFRERETPLGRSGSACQAPPCYPQASGAPRRAAARRGPVQAQVQSGLCRRSSGGHPQAARLLGRLLQPLLLWWSSENLSFGVKSSFQDLLFCDPPHPPPGKACQCRDSHHQGLAWETGRLSSRDPGREPLRCSPTAPRPVLHRGGACTSAWSPRGPQERHPPEAPSHIWALPGKGSAHSHGRCDGGNTIPPQDSSRTWHPCSSWAEAVEWVPPAQSTGPMWASWVPRGKERRVDSLALGCWGPHSEVQSGLHSPGVNSIHTVPGLTREGPVPAVSRGFSGHRGTPRPREPGL